MGYMSLDTWGDSDMAADAYNRMINAMVEVLNDALEETANHINTDGCVNVALIIESGIFDIVPTHMLENFNATLLVNKLEGHINSANADRKADWDNEANRKQHLKAYLRLYAVADKLYQQILSL